MKKFIAIVMSMHVRSVYSSLLSACCRGDSTTEDSRSFRDRCSYQTAQGLASEYRSLRSPTSSADITTDQSS